MKNTLQGMAAKIGRFRFNTEAGRAGLSETEGSADGQTGGLKLMTVFIVVLALHLVVIGGISAWHFIKGPGDAAAETKNDAVAAAGAETPAADSATEAQADAASPTTVANGKDGSMPAEGSEVTGATAPAPVAIPATPAKSVAAVPAKPVAPVAAQPQAPAPAMAAGSKTYVVKSGDTLHHIAKANGMSVAQLKEMNHLASDMLKIGQKLVVKDAAASAPAPAAAPAAAPAPAVVATVLPPAAPASQAAASMENRSYTVAKGDTLTKIAKQFKVTPAAIMAANSPKLSDPKKLKIGEVLTIPVKGDRHEVSQGPAPLSPVPTLRTSSPDLVMNK